MRSNNKKKTISEPTGMVDVGDKSITLRTAQAVASIKLGSKVFEELIKKGSPKGDVFETARVAGIIAAKSTSTIIPHCHPITLDSVKIWFEPQNEKKKVMINSEVRCWGKTGVEMEALNSVSAAALTIYDMMKWADKGMVISEVKLLSKTGGKSGDYLPSKKKR
jgi:cyclic pyranopterin phosphate synthase